MRTYATVSGLLTDTEETLKQICVEATMFDESKIYYSDDPALRVIGARQTLAGWRSKGCGPDYLKIGSRVAYCGSDLNAWIESRKVRTTAAA